MLLWRETPRSSGEIWLAWRPVYAEGCDGLPAGKVWLEHVRWKYIAGWGWGSDGYYEYHRIPLAEIQEYKARKIWAKRLTTSGSRG